MDPPPEETRLTRGTDPYSTSKLPTLQFGATMFDGIDDYLLGPVLPKLGSEMTLLVAFRTEGRGGGGPGKGGWIVSSNDLFSPPVSGPTGFGLLLDDSGVLRPLVGSENRYTSTRRLPAGMHVVSMEVSPTSYRLWVNSTLEFDKLDTADPRNPVRVGPRSAHFDPGQAGENILNSSRGVHLGVGATPLQLDEYFQGGVAEVLVFSSVLNDLDRQRAERALCLRWQTCAPQAQQVSWELLHSEMRESGRYYNARLNRVGGSDGLLRVAYSVAGSATPGVDYFLPPGHVTWEHGDSEPKYVSIRILEHFERRFQDWFVTVSLAVGCATYPDTVSVTLDEFRLDVRMVPNPYWTSVDSVEEPFFGGRNITFQAHNLDRTVDYNCRFNVPEENCACEGDGTHPGDTSCARSTQTDCATAEAPCSQVMLRSFVDYELETVTCTRDAWSCPGSVASMQLVRASTDADLVCSRADGDINSVSEALRQIGIAEDVHYNYSFSCHVPPWTAVDTVGIPGNRIDHTYLEPNISSVTRRNGAVVGGTMLTLYGTYFSVQDSSPVIQVGGTDCVTSTWTSDTSLACETAAGWGGDHRIFWHSEGSTTAIRSEANARYSYDLPTVTAVSPEIVDQTGGVAVTIFGENFGEEDRHTQFRFFPQQRPELLEEQWVSDSSVNAVVQPGFGGVDTIEARVGTGADEMAKNTTTSSGAGYFGYDRSYVYSVQGPSPLNPRGGDALSITGRLFGTSPNADLRLQVGKTEGPRLVWTSDTAVEAVTPPGAGKDVPVYVSVNGLWAITTATVSYPTHTVTAIHPAHSPVQETAEIVLLGSNFGPALEVEGQYGLGSPEVNLGEQIQIGATECRSISYSSSSSVLCRVEHGIGGGHDVSLRINGYASTLEASFSYDLPRPLAVEPSFLSPTIDENATLYITGDNFGRQDFNASARIGATQCGETTWVSDSSISCVHGAAGLPLRGIGSVPVVVSVGGQSTPWVGPKAVHFCYSAPRVTDVKPIDAPASGGRSCDAFRREFWCGGLSHHGVVGGHRVCQHTVGKRRRASLHRIAGREL